MLNTIFKFKNILSPILLTLHITVTLENFEIFIQHQSDKTISDDLRINSFLSLFSYLTWILPNKAESAILKDRFQEIMKIIESTKKNINGYDYEYDFTETFFKETVSKKIIDNYEDKFNYYSNFKLKFLNQIDFIGYLTTEQEDMWNILKSTDEITGKKFIKASFHRNLNYSISLPWPKEVLIPMVLFSTYHHTYLNIQDKNKPKLSYKILQVNDILKRTSSTLNTYNKAINLIKKMKNF